MPEGTVITEGSTKLLVPQTHSVSGPGRIESGSVFFNEQMAFNRDVSVMVLRALGRPSMTVADAMTATGARAVRIGNEVPGTEVTANDIDPAAIPFIERNIELNGLANVHAHRGNMVSLFAEESFDYVDLDPFGSPSLFIQSVIRGTKRKGVMAITATDTAPLDGAQAPKCRRRYQCEPVRGYLCHEGGLRILLCNIAMEVGKFDIGMRPILSFFADHYYRCYVELQQGTAACDRMLDQLGYMHYNMETLERSVSPEYDSDHKLGPFWTGPLFDKDLLSRMNPEGMAKEKKCTNTLGIWREEIDSVPYLYDLSELSRFTKLSPPSLQQMIDKLKETGDASRTHFSPTSFITTQPLGDILAAYREIGHPTPAPQGKSE